MDPANYWCTPVDGYCERTDASFWSEPVNAFSNAAFIVAAAYAYVLLRRRGGGDWPALWLIGVTAVVGIGSFLFHTFANKWSLVADVAPIAVFIYSYFLLAMTRFLGQHALTGLGLTFAFAAFNMSFVKLWKAVFGQVGVDATNGSVGYFPAALAMFGVGALLLALARPRAAVAAGASARVGDNAAAGRALVLAGFVFCASLVFRTVDAGVCGWLPLGTHFLWHVLNGFVLFLLARAAIAYGPRRRAASPVSAFG